MTNFGIFGQIYTQVWGKHCNICCEIFSDVKDLLQRIFQQFWHLAVWIVVWKADPRNPRAILVLPCWENDGLPTFALLQATLDIEVRAHLHSTNLVVEEAKKLGARYVVIDRYCTCSYVSVCWTLESSFRESLLSCSKILPLMFHHSSSKVQNWQSSLPFCSLVTFSMLFWMRRHIKKDKKIYIENLTCYVTRVKTLTNFEHLRHGLPCEGLDGETVCADDKSVGDSKPPIKAISKEIGVSESVQHSESAPQRQQQTQPPSPTSVVLSSNRPGDFYNDGSITFEDSVSAGIYGPELIGNAYNIQVGAKMGGFMNNQEQVRRWLIDTGSRADPYSYYPMSVHGKSEVMLCWETALTISGVFSWYSYLCTLFNILTPSFILFYFR